MPSGTSRTVSRRNVGPAPGTERFGGHGDPEPRPGGTKATSSAQAGSAKGASGRKTATKSSSKTGKLAEAGAMLAGQPEVAEGVKAADAKRQARKASKAAQKPPAKPDSGGTATTTTTTDEGISGDLKDVGKGLWGLTNPWRERDSAVKAIKAEYLIGFALIALYPLVRSGGLGNGYLVTWSKKLISWTLLFVLYLWLGALNRGFARVAASLGALTVLALLLTQRTSKETLVIADIFKRINAILDPSNKSHLTAADQSQNPAFDELINTATSAVKGGVAGGLKAPKVTGNPRTRPTKNLGKVRPSGGGGGSILPQLPVIQPPKVAPPSSSNNPLKKLFPWLP